MVSVTNMRYGLSHKCSNNITHFSYWFKRMFIFLICQTWKLAKQSKAEVWPRFWMMLNWIVGFVKVVSWISLSCYSDLLEFLDGCVLRQGTSSQHQYCYLDLVIWYWYTICQLNQFNTNIEAAMLSRLKMKVYIANRKESIRSSFSRKKDCTQ